jgi:hypothetical protein
VDRHEAGDGEPHTAQAVSGFRFDPEVAAGAPPVPLDGWVLRPSRRAGHGFLGLALDAGPELLRVFAADNADASRPATDQRVVPWATFGRDPDGGLWLVASIEHPDGVHHLVVDLAPAAADVSALDPVALATVIYPGVDAMREGLRELETGTDVPVIGLAIGDVQLPT